jgi:hypothetical protein
MTTSFNLALAASKRDNRAAELYQRVPLSTATFSILSYTMSDHQAAPNSFESDTPMVFTGLGGNGIDPQSFYAGSSTRDTPFSYGGPVNTTQLPPSPPASNQSTESRQSATLLRAQQYHAMRQDQANGTLGRAAQLHTNTTNAIRLNNLAMANATARRVVGRQSSPRSASSASPSRVPMANPGSYPHQSATGASSSAALQQFNDLESLLFGTRFQIPDAQWPVTETPIIPAAPATGATTRQTAIDNREAGRASVNMLARRNALVPPSPHAPLAFTRRTGTVNPSIHPQFRSKVVVRVYCAHCTTEICKRGMKAILLGNTKVELYSTDTPPAGVQLVYNDYTTRNCLCRIRDGACLGCGNVVGYHVTQPCDGCMEACNNGHLHMFHSDNVTSVCVFWRF